VEVISAFETITGQTLTEGYGLTETSPVTHSTPFLAKRKPGSIGLPLTSTECRIVDIESGEREVGVGEDGELCIRGPQVMKGYWRKPEETAHAIRNGWFYTGDVARMDEDGFFYIVQRKKDMIIVSGFNVYPNEVEEVLLPTRRYARPASSAFPTSTGAKRSRPSSCSRREPRLRAGIVRLLSRATCEVKLPSLIEFSGSPKSAVGVLGEVSARWKRNQQRSEPWSGASL
jgi:long-chain acyl-CoA synthetase